MNLGGGMLNGAFNTMFQKYDRDNSGFLDQNEVIGFFNGVFSMLHVPITVGQKEGWVLIKIMDKNGDGRISRDQLYNTVSRILSVGSIAGAIGGGGSMGGNNQGGYNQGGYNQGNQGGFNQGGYNQGGYNQGGYNQGGYNQGGQGGYNQGGYNQGGYNQGGYNQGGYNQGGYNQGGYNGGF